MKKITAIILCSIFLMACSSSAKQPAKLDTALLVKAEKAYRQGRLVDAEIYYLKIAEAKPGLI